MRISASHIAFNLSLAAIPVALSIFFAYGATREKKSIGHIAWSHWIPLLAVWFFFWPNTCYLLTEWRHYLDFVTTSPGIYDDPQTRVYFMIVTGFYVLYSGSGMIACFLSLWPIDRVVRLPTWLKGILFLVCSLGVYLGLIDRYNSWNILKHSTQILGTAIAAIGKPGLDLFIVGFAAVLWLLYGLFCLTMTGAALRFRLSK